MSPTLDSKPNPPPDSANTRLAKILHSQRDEIINVWFGQVIKDPAIPTDSLTVAQVRDFLPQLFDDLTRALSLHGSEGIAEPSGKDGEEYGAARWQQGFELPAMLRELTHLRSILIERLGRFEADKQNFGDGAWPFVTTTLDRMGIDAIEQFLTKGLHESELAPAAPGTRPNPPANRQ